VLIQPFDPHADTPQLRACHQIMAAARPVDHPGLPPQSFPRFAAWWAHGGVPARSWLARDQSGEPAGCCLLTLPDRQNQTMAGCCLVILPARRRAGLGAELLAHCAAQARQAGRSRLASTGATRTRVRDGSPGAAFAAAAGASSGLAEVIRTQEITPDLGARLAGLRAEAASCSAGYELLSWAGASPDNQAAAVARVHGAMADAPRVAGTEPDAWDAARVRQAEQAELSNGQVLYTVAARLAGTAELAALTQVSTDPAVPGWALQDITAVLPGHRGHRLGLRVKIGMLDLLARQEPGLRRILTGNTQSNDHMMAINSRLGYQISDIYWSWELDLR
jgi:GNAT superfamily N-acetyltransferase